MKEKFVEQEKTNERLVDPATAKQDIGTYKFKMGKEENSPYVALTNYVEIILTEKQKNLLYEGIDDYEKIHEQKVKEFAKKMNGFGVNTNFSSPKYFRELYWEHMNEILRAKDNYIDPKKKEYFDSNEREKAGTKLRNFLGDKQLEELYKLALEEEMNSKEYRNALFNRSINEIDGPTGDKKLLVLLGGASGSGKSSALKVLVNEVLENQNLKGQETNFCTSLDGALAREVSQMRSITAACVEKKGYSGTIDLQKASDILDGVKNTLEKVAFAENNLNIAIPETFSKIYSINFMMKYLNMLHTPDRIMVFGRVEAKKDAVAFMGTDRAYKDKAEKEKDYSNQCIDPNAKSEKEHKRYNSAGFIWGDLGSKIAQHIFNMYQMKVQEKNPEKSLLSFVLNNDLSLKTEKGKKILVSDRIYDEWVEKHQEKYNKWKECAQFYKASTGESLAKGDDILSLEDYKKECGWQPPLIDASENKSNIKVVTEFLLNVTKLYLKKEIASMNAQLGAQLFNPFADKEKRNELREKLEHYQKIHESIKSESKSSVYKVIKNSLEFLNPNTDLRGVISKMYDQASQTENFLDFKNNYKSAVRPGACVELSEEQDTHHSFNMNS
ncbi:hypothetical protein CAB17_09810 [Legionella sainthelensi]|uniref:Uncharacterized protein n=2 Tax=Legionella sainthelensi TaxID=28087 RepID=A0A2H5FLA0_9GAMM|nr:hypothetical protein CAB17_09810 [Legionella sainthelensi]